MKIKQLSASDIKLIKTFEIENPAIKGIFIYPSNKEIDFCFKNPHSKLYGIFDKNLLVGWGGYRTNYKDEDWEPGTFELSAIYVASIYQGRGLGKVILEKVIQELKKNEKYKKIFLTVSPLNVKALMLYLSSGFVVFDFKKNYYGKGEDWLFMSLFQA